MLSPCSGKTEGNFGGAEVGGLIASNRAEQTGKEFEDEKEGQNLRYRNEKHP